MVNAVGFDMTLLLYANESKGKELAIEICYYYMALAVFGFYEQTMVFAQFAKHSGFISSFSELWFALVGKMMFGNGT